MPGLQVIGAGLGRTGTTSLKLALEQLGHKVYHMTEVHKYGDGNVWMELSKAIAAEDKTQIVATKHSIFTSLENRGFTATTDYPTCTI